MSSFDAILFDKDGTLFDFSATWSGWAERFLDVLAEGDEALKVTAAGAIGVIPGGGFLKDSVAIAGTADEIADALRSAIPGRSDLKAVVDAVAAETPQVQVPGLLATLDRLAASHVLGVMTNDSEAPARRHLAGAEIDHHFQMVIGYDSGFGAKPSPDPLLAFATEVAVEPSRVLMVGDSLHDLHAGRAAGMGTAAVLTGIAEAAELAPHADVVLPDIVHLPDWLG